MDYMLTNVERHQQDRTAQMQDFGSFYKGGRSASEKQWINIYIFPI